jgi:hypothetical protein
MIDPMSRAALPRPHAPAVIEHDPMGASSPSVRMCGARTRAGGTCRRHAMAGQARCDYHGGKSPQAMRAAAERTARQGVADRLGRLGVDVPENADPLQVMSLALAVAHGDLEAMRAKVAEVDPTDASDPTVRLYGEALDRAATLAKEATRLNLDERLSAQKVRVQAKQVEFFTKGLEVYRDATGMSEEAHQRGVRAMADKFREMDPGHG